jgi:hypothetical protein
VLRGGKLCTETLVLSFGLFGGIAQLGCCAAFLAKRKQTYLSCTFLRELDLAQTDFTCARSSLVPCPLFELEIAGAVTRFTLDGLLEALRTLFLVMSSWSSSLAALRFNGDFKQTQVL